MTALRCEDGISVKVDAITAIGDVQESRWSRPKAESNREETGVKYYFWVFVGGKGYQTLKTQERGPMESLHNVVTKAVFGV
jgi:hypothetical protein